MLSTRPRGVFLRVCVVVVSLMVGAALTEGVYSFATGSSLVTRILSGGAVGGGSSRTGFFDEERIDAGKLTKGPRAADPDRDVGFTMKWRHEREIVEARATTDEYGQRTRVGPEPEPGASRVVLLGDSVAFGYGVTDTETFGHHLEEHLAKTMADGGKRPLVMTVASPDWNNRAQIRYFLNHIGRLDPDVVVFMPVANDLDDQPHINEFGAREPGYDPAAERDTAYIASSQFWQLWRVAQKRLPRGRLLRITGRGEVFNAAMQITYQGLTPESLRRWDAVATRFADLKRRLDLRGCKIMLAFRSAKPFELLFDGVVRHGFPDLVVRYFFRGDERYDRLESDSHPSPAFTRAGGWCMADELIKRGWISGAGKRPLSALDDRYRERLHPPVAFEDVSRQIARRHATWREFHETGFDLETCVGLQHVYGGLSVDGHVGPQVLFGLKNSGQSQLLLDLTRLPAASGVYPMSLTVSFNGVVSVTREVPEPTEQGQDLRLTFPVPSSVQDAELVDVKISASNWVVKRVLRKSSLVAWKLRRVGFTDG